MLLHAGEVGGLEARRDARQTQQLAQLGDRERGVQRPAPPDHVDGAQTAMLSLEQRQRVSRRVGRLEENGM